MIAALTHRPDQALVPSRPSARPRIHRRLARSLVLGVVLVLASASATLAATPGTWTGWTQNSASGCWIAAQVPYVNTYHQVVAYAEVYCPQTTWLTIRERIRSDRSFADDITVATAGCAATGTCPVLVSAGYHLYFAACPKTTSVVTHGYHTDILIYPGTNYASATGTKSGSASLSVYCRA